MGDNVTEIVLSGGPCSGKSTSLASLSAKLVEWGYRPLIVPELATTLMSGGLHDLGAIAGRDHAHFLEIEKQMLLMMRAARLQYLALAQTFVQRGEKVVLIYDRAEADVAAYVGPEDFARLCGEAGLSVLDVRDSYDAVIYLVTAAIGAEHAYTTANNATRRETIEEAREVDLRTRTAWQGHPNLWIVDNSTDFQGKIARVLAVTARILGIPEPLEIDPKFVPDAAP
jgi:predicted ATPase